MIELQVIMEIFSQLWQGIKNAMDKLLIAVSALLIALGTFVLARAKDGNIAAVDKATETITRGTSPSGLRNNNPFNIEFRSSINWRGQVGTDGRFVIFDTALNGIRAGMINIHTKMTRDGLNTVRKIISRLSPAVENPTEAFIQFVAGRMSVAPDQPLTWRPHIIAMSKAIIQFENGEQPFSNDELNNALQATGRV
jgi:hypothetical protein